MPAPRYSVLISVYAKENPEYFRCALESVIHQTLPPSEILIVCDGELPEELDKVCDDYAAEYPSLFHIERYPENHGLGYALNYGLSKVAEEKVMRMDSDDIALPTRAEETIPLLNQYDVVGSWIKEFEGTADQIIGERVVPERYPEILKYAKKRNPFNHPSVCFRKACVIDAGGYLDLPYFEDYYLWVRVLLKTHDVYNVQRSLVLMRSGKEMRARRGGKAYRKSLRQLRRFMRRTGFIRLREYLLYTPAQLFFSILSPNIKNFLYRLFLRGKAQKNDKPSN